MRPACYSYGTFQKPLNSRARVRNSCGKCFCNTLCVMHEACLQLMRTVSVTPEQLSTHEELLGEGLLCDVLPFVPAAQELGMQTCTV
eukprot:scaffold178777_cov18-Tisochrysis_lutea.AAC.2